MINTYSADLHPPPVPPRPGTQSSMRNPSRSHIRFLSAAFVVETVVIIALFLYLFQRIGSESNEESATLRDVMVLKRLEECEGDTPDRGSLLDCQKVLEKFKRVMSKVSQTEGMAGSLSAPGTLSGTEALAQMKVERPSEESSNKILQWNRDHSMLKNVDYFTVRRLLEIRIPGYYYIHSHVTFSKPHPRVPLAQSVMRRRSSAEGVLEDLLLKAFCSLRSGDVCTSSQAGIVRLEEGQQLYVNVTDLSLVSFDVTTTTFGLFLLQRDP